MGKCHSVVPEVVPKEKNFTLKKIKVNQLETIKEISEENIDDFSLTYHEKIEKQYKILELEYEIICSELSPLYFS